MAKSNAQRVREYQQRQFLKRERMRTALVKIVGLVKDRPGPVSQEVARIAEEALGG